MKIIEMIKSWFRKTGQQLDSESRWAQLKEDLKEGYLSKAEDKLITDLHTEYLSMQNKINGLKENPLEDYYNNKYPKKDIDYLRHETDGDYRIDVRNFLTINDFHIPIVEGKTDDEKALNGLKWIINHIVYISDKATYNYPEYWSYPYQTLLREGGDCEDGAILLYCILVKSGVPYWKCRVLAGDTPYGGHAYLNYFCEKTNSWKTLDWCFFKNLLQIDKRKDYKEDKLYGNVWFSFSHKYSFSNGTKLRKAYQEMGVALCKSCHSSIHGYKNG